MPEVVLAVAFGGLSFLPIRPGVRIPVHAGWKHMGYIDDNGWLVEPARWKYVSPFHSDGFGYVSGGGLYRIDRAGRLERRQPPPQAGMSAPRYRPLPDKRGMILMQDVDRETGRSRCHWVGSDGKPAFPGEWEDARPFGDNDLAAVMSDGGYGFIDRTGKTVIALEWDDTRGFGVSRFAPVMRNGRWGVVDETGRLVVPPRFFDLSAYDEHDMAVARLSDCGFINPQGRFVIPPIYQNCGPFDCYGMARVVNLAGKCGWIGRDGAVRVGFLYDAHPGNVTLVDHPRVLPVAVDGLGGLVDRGGKVLVPPSSGSVRWVGDPLVPEREWYVRVPTDRDSHPYGGKVDTPEFVPGCYDESGRLIWAGSWTGVIIARWRIWCRSLAGVLLLHVLASFWKRRRAERSGEWIAGRVNSPFIRKLREWKPTERGG